MNSSNGLNAMNAAPEAYTDLQGLQRLRNNPDKDQALKQVAQQFEAMFLNLLLKNMREANAVFEEGNPLNSNESNMVRDMYDNQLSLSMAQAKGTGLADALYRQMSGSYPGALAANPETAATHTEPTLADLRRLRQVIDRQVEKAADAADPASVSQPSEIDASSATTQRAAMANNPADFIEKLLPYAQAAADKLGVDAKMLLAQAALETGWGQKVLADTQGASSNNLFNIKASAAWRGEVVPVQALEFRDGVAIREQSQFKKYASPAQSFEDFVALVQESPRYARAVEQAPEAENFIQALHEAGYATDPQYADKVMSVYRNLQQDAFETTDASETTDIPATANAAFGQNAKG